MLVIFIFGWFQHGSGAAGQRAAVRGCNNIIRGASRRKLLHSDLDRRNCARCGRGAMFEDKASESKNFRENGS